MVSRTVWVLPDNRDEMSTSLTPSLPNLVSGFRCTGSVLVLDSDRGFGHEKDDMVRRIPHSSLKTKQKCVLTSWLNFIL